MYCKLTKDEIDVINRISDITITDYDLNGEYMPVDSWQTASYDLLNEVTRLQEQIQDIINDREANYRAITKAEQYDF